MKKFLIPLPLLIASLGLAAEPMTKYDSKPGSKVTLEGTSSMHEWVVEGNIIGG